MKRKIFRLFDATLKQVQGDRVGGSYSHAELVSASHPIGI